ncbi:amidohydrolase family protein [Sulfuriflexus mobilis]|uniref:amidohydrolase family protein n=1 Tax=Sulfuriflexus mobilis TaxID=1811807 RepID=UPI000F82683F|nr:amidohydrolase family protein [Sulfuriflexus mobilis]
MDSQRRKILRSTLALSAGSLVGQTTLAGGLGSSAPPTGLRRIAIEEAFATPELFEQWQTVLADPASHEPGFKALYRPFLNSPATRPIRDRLLDLGELRLNDMKNAGVDFQVLSITAPGLQVFSPAKATSFAQKTNDRLAEVVQEHPQRFAGLAAVAPQAPGQAARELERAITSLGLKGAIINSHTQGRYLDDKYYRVIFETAQALDVPIYLHPRTPSPDMMAPYSNYGLEGAGWGFAAETSLHAMRLILSGLFDELPRLKIILGHLGEGLPFWLSRIDSRFANKTWTDLDSSGSLRRLKKAPSEYIRDNFYIATSGMHWHPVLMFAHSVIGADRLLFAADYPYESSAEAVRQLDSAPMSDKDKKKIYQTNAESLLKLSTSIS